MIRRLLAIMSTTSSITGVLVWASECVAYIRYHNWVHNHRKRRILYDRWNPQRDTYAWHKSQTLLASLQPVPAWIGLIACSLVVFSSAANWWKVSNRTFNKVATAYAGVSVLYFVQLTVITDRLAAGHTSDYILRFEITQQESMGCTRRRT
jgi:yeast amino acid transporter